MPTRRSLLSVVIAGALVAACSDSAPTVAPIDANSTSPAALQSQTLNCSANVAARTLSCADAASGTVSRSPIIVGGQNVYVKLTSSNLSYNAGTGGTFAFDVTVQNLAPQAMGTTDGATGDGTGVDVFFQQNPSVTSGSGAITFVNATGTGTYLSSNQTFYRYPGAKLGGDNILSQNETSSTLNWQLNVPNTVTTFSFSVYVSANVAAPTGYISLASSPNMMTAGTQVLSATVKSAVGNTIAGQTVTFGTNNAAVATVASDGTVTGVGPGTTTITATSGTRSGAAVVSVCPNLAVGSVYEYSGTAAASFCLGGTGAGQEYVVIPYNGDNATTVGLGITGTSISTVVGVPTPSISASRSPVGLDIFQPQRDYAWEANHRARELALMRSVGPIVSASRSMSGSGLRPTFAITPGVPVVGATMTLNVNGTDGCTNGTNHVATVKSVGTRIILMEDNTNPAGGLSNAQYDAIAATFDTLVYPRIVGAFGAPLDIDNNQRVIALYTAAVNDLTPPGNPNSYIGGFFFSRDILAVGPCPTTNFGEMFYMLAPDPTGVHGNNRTVGLVDSSTVGTLGHEFQHLINASIRVNAGHNYENAWLNEGMAHIAEEEIYFASSTNTAGNNITLANITASQAQLNAFNTFNTANFARFRQHLAVTESDSPTQNDDDLGTRGSAWAFLRYAMDRKGGSTNTFLSALITTVDTGRTNLTNRLGTSMDVYLKDWAVSLYADDAAIGSVSPYLQPSWNFRSVMPALFGSYPLTVRNPATGVAENLSLTQNSASYLRMGVGASTFATVSVAKSGGGPLPSNLSVIVLRRK